MSTNRMRPKKSFENSTVMDKLLKASVRLDMCENNDNEFKVLENRYHANIKRFTTLSSLYQARFLFSIVINLTIFILLAFFFIESVPSTEIIALLMLNFVAISTLLLSSAISFSILDRMDKLSEEADELYDDVNGFISQPKRVN